MATSDKGEAAARDRRAKSEKAEELGGIASAFGRAADLGPQVLLLQQALLGGIALSQRREAERLKALAADDDRIAAALDRAERASALQAEATVAATAAGRAAEVFQKTGLFHGYVVQADGAPATGFTVNLRGVEGASARRGRAKTDQDGYFRIELDVPGETKPRQGAHAAVVDHLYAIGAAPAEPAAAETDQKSTEVEVLDPSGRAVFRDPNPPSFTGDASAFRYYLIDGPAETKPTGAKKA